MNTKLCCVPEKNYCKIINIIGTQRNKLAELGFSKELIVYVELTNSNIMKVKCRGYYIALRKSEAEKILVEIIK
jgi:Fe2+ transport system protein FeoA